MTSLPEIQAECPFCDYGGPQPILADWDDVVVFEPLNPVTDGHVIVVPRRHVEDATRDPILTARVFEVAAREADWRVGGDCNLITSIGPDATQTVKHLHVHVVPRRAGDGLMLPWSSAALAAAEAERDALLAVRETARAFVATTSVFRQRRDCRSEFTALCIALQDCQPGGSAHPGHDGEGQARVPGCLAPPTPKEGDDDDAADVLDHAGRGDVALRPEDHRRAEGGEADERCEHRGGADRAGDRAGAPSGRGRVGAVPGSSAAVPGVDVLVSSGSGGPGVHLTADEAEQIAFVLEGRSHSLNCGIWVSGEPCTCGREAALVLLRPAVRGGGQADTEGEL